MKLKPVIMLVSEGDLPQATISEINQRLCRFAIAHASKTSDALKIFDALRNYPQQPHAVVFIFKKPEPVTSSRSQIFNNKKWKGTVVSMVETENDIHVFSLDGEGSKEEIEYEDKQTDLLKLLGCLFQPNNQSLNA